MRRFSRAPDECGRRRVELREGTRRPGAEPVRGLRVVSPPPIDVCGKFIETDFGLPALTARDQNSADLTDAFAFQPTPSLPPR